MSKILIFSIYPAPYRTAVIDEIKKTHDVDVFFEGGGGDGRNPEWFKKGDYYFLDDSKDVKIFNRLIKNIKKYDLIFLMDYTCKTAVKLNFKCRRNKVPYVINCDGVILIKHGNPLKELLKKYLVRGAAGYLASGEHAKEYLLHYGAKEDKIYFHPFTTVFGKDVLESPLSENEKTLLRKKLNLPEKSKIAIAVGRFIPLKRYDVLIKLWAKMPPDAYLLLIGGGEEKEKYKRIINAEGLKNVILEDFRKPDEITEYMRASDVFVHPTSYDVWGLVINEAMAAGLPIVVTDTCVAGTELIKSGENGYLVKLYDDDNLIDKTKKLLLDDGLREKISLNALNTIRDFTVENMVKTQVNNVGKILENGKN